MHETASHPNEGMARKEGQISKESEGLAATVETLKSRVLVLRESISPILRNGPNKTEVAGETKTAEPLVDVALQFKNRRMEIVEILDTVNKMINEVEL